MVYFLQADQRFVWNGHVLRELAQQPELSQYCLPVVLGCILYSSAGVGFCHTISVVVALTSISAVYGL